jgi:putative PIN family toxin of toxin-antitoxin system
MKVVLDTNVLVSAILKDRSLPAVSVHRAVARGSLLKSTATEQQLFAVLARPYFSPLVAPPAIDWLRTMLAAAELVPITERIAVCRDPTDDIFLELAVNGRADLIISGDADLLVLNPFRSIPIISPATFVRTTAGTIG